MPITDLLPDCKSSLKAVLPNNVVVGKGCKLRRSDETLIIMMAPPTGYDSMGKVNCPNFDWALIQQKLLYVLRETGGLNYDELVAYTNDVIRQSFLAMYETK
jgi:hypothetical protein